MAVTRQLYELQELDNDIENTRQTLDVKMHQLGNRGTLEKAGAVLAAEQKALEDLKRKRREDEAKVADITAKINEVNKQLYGGRVSNSKELSNLQSDVNMLTGQKDGLETKSLEVLEKLEESDKKAATLTADYQKLEVKWTAEQEQLKKDTELLTKTLEALQASRQEAVSKIDPATLSLYEIVRKKKKQAVARVERGICQSCRLTISASLQQKARAGHPVQCGTCGRILYVS
jgi:predicted  nucleic acid-binding Zn-ribbon protein